MTNDERERLRLAEQAIIELKKDRDSMKESLQAIRTDMGTIKHDTGELVSMFKGGRLLGLGFRWLVVTAGAIGSVWYMLKGGK